MPHYMMRWAWKDSSIRAMVDHPQDRETIVRRAIDGFGGTLQSYYFMLGEYDGLLIAEFPDNVAATACSMQVSATGAFARFETHTLITPEEAQKSMKLAKSGAAVYKAPADQDA